LKYSGKQNSTTIRVGPAAETSDALMCGNA
jgi:hypothetical protein